MITVVGAGPVGLVAAMIAHQRGLPVRVLEARREGVLDKACGEGLMPGGVQRLEALGVRPDPDGSRPFAGVRYIAGEERAEGRFPHGHGLGIRRLHLHRALLDRVASMGIPIEWNTKVEALPPGPVIGADGLNSTVRRLAGLDGGPRGGRFGLRRHYRLAPWTELVEVHWGEGCEAYVTPVGPERVGVAFLWSGFKARFDELLARFPALVERLGGAPTDSEDRGAGPLERSVKAPVQGEVYLVGDAGGYLDAITGEGLSLGFAQAEAAVEAIIQRSPSAYAHFHANQVRGPFALMRLLLFVERHPLLVRRMVRALGREPEVFGRCLAINDGAPISSLGWGGPRLAARLLTA